jgi:hypothetical protein
MTTTIPELSSVDFARPLGGLEHFLSLIDQHRAVHFAMAAQIEGRTTISEWRTALDKLQERHPLLRVAIEMNPGQAPHFRTIGTNPIPLRIALGPKVSRWEEEVAKELATPFDSRQAPLARAVLMHGQNDSVFILTTHHSIADGLSSAYAVRDILHALAGEDLEPLPSLPALDSLVYMSQLAPSDSNESGQPEPPPEDRALAFRTIDDSLPRIEALSLTPEMTWTLIERARIERTTVHGALCSALVLAGRESYGDWEDSPVRVLSPFNLRKELGIGEDCGLFVWSAKVAMSPGTPADFWNAARLAKSSLAPQQSLGRVVIRIKGLEDAMSAGIDVQGAAQIHKQGFQNELVLTNLGKLPVQFDTGGLRLKALWGPAVLGGFEGEQTVGVTTTNDSLCLLHTSFKPIPSLLSRAAEILQSACE